MFRRSLRVVKEAGEKSIYPGPSWRARQLPHVRIHTNIYYTHEKLEPGTEIIPVVCRPRYPRDDRVAPTTGEDAKREKLL